MKLPDESSNFARAGVGANPGRIQCLPDVLGEIYGGGNARLEMSSDLVRMSVRRTIVQISIGVGATVRKAIELAAAVFAFGDLAGPRLRRG